ncbi:aminoacetone oxidase family FAD-binding enzyme [bacterium D16-51]|nr:aminoacetone oxidase family FAD-binding enzyme [bacterium D16-59]RKI59762.1 aminoacetone oxidase family FAD-binding enzyme [bacterium D16-51]
MTGHVHVLVIGGGASGMAAAITAARYGAGVLVLEKKNSLGKKLLATGNGKCNFTNQAQHAGCYHSTQKDYPWKVIRQFGWQESVSFFDGIGILAKDRDGYVYPASGQASSMLHALQREMRRLSVSVHTGEEAVSVSVNPGGGFTVTTGSAEYQAEKVILSTGGMASPVHGSTGDGYGFAKSFGHHLVQPLPALASLVLKDSLCKLWGGVRVQGTVSLYSGKGRLLREESGELQMVSYGISGIPVFQLSRFAAKELEMGRNVTLCLNSMPEHGREWLENEFLKRKKYDGKQSIRDLLEGMLPDKLASVYVKKLKIADSARAEEITKEQFSHLAALIRRMEFPVQAVSGFEKAQVTAGGICTEEVAPDTMESCLCRGLYFTGELLDVDGDCGGYNLQWAWATGFLAGRAAGMDRNGGRNDTYQPAQSTGGRNHQKGAGRACKTGKDRKRGTASGKNGRGKTSADRRNRNR